MKTFTLFTLFILCIASKIFSQAGSLDSTFGHHHNGKVLTGFFEGSAFVNTGTLQADGKIIAAGYVYSQPYNSSEFALTRYMTNGELDRSFGTAGKVLTQIRSSAVCNDVAVQDNGKIVAVGESDVTYNNYYSYKFDIVLVRYKESGKPDSSFGKHGIVITNFNDDSYATGVATQKDKKIVIAGSTLNPKTNDYSLILVRYNLDGKIDSTFGINGFTTTHLKEKSLISNSIALQQNGKIIVSATSISNNNYTNFLAARYTTNGTLDSSFGKNGITTANFEEYDYCKSMTLQPDDKILLIGFHTSAFYYGDTINYGLARFTKNGVLDSSFSYGHDGKLTTIFNYNDFGESVVVQTDGKIIEGGSYFDLARYNKNGIIDSSYGKAGKVEIPIGTLSKIILQPDGKVIGMGVSAGEFALARYNGDSTSFTNNTIPQPQNATTNKPISIYLSPNPVKNILNIQGLSALANTIAIIDIKGKTLQTIVTSNKNYLLNVQQLTAGIYFIKVDDGKNITTLKFIKQ